MDLVKKTDLMNIGLAPEDKRILVIDDIFYIKKDISRTLESEGGIVYTVSTGREAIEKMDLYNPSLLIMDVNLVDINGLELLSLLRNYINNNNIKIMIVSAIRDKRMVKKVFAYGIDYYLIKPYKKSHLADIVNKLLIYRKLQNEGKLCTRKNYLHYKQMIVNEAKEAGKSKSVKS